MRALIYKDNHTLGWTTLTFGLIILSVAGLALFGKYSMFFSLFAMLIFSELPLSVWSMDTKSHWHKYCDTLPFSRQMAVNEKFLLVLFNNMGCLCLIEICLITGNLIRGEQLFDVKNVLLLSSFFFVLAAIGIALMLMILINYVAATIVIGCTGGLMGGLNGTAIGEEAFFAVETVGRFSFLNNPKFHICVAVVGIVIFAVSWLVTLAVYKRKSV